MGAVACLLVRQHRARHVAGATDTPSTPCADSRGQAVLHDCCSVPDAQVSAVGSSALASAARTGTRPPFQVTAMCVAQRVYPHSAGAWRLRVPRRSRPQVARQLSPVSSAAPTAPQRRHYARHCSSARYERVLGARKREPHRASHHSFSPTSAHEHPERTHHPAAWPSTHQPPRVWSRQWRGHQPVDACGGRGCARGGV